MDRVVVFVPGIKGSFLRSAEKRVWLEAGALLRRGGESLALPRALEPDGVIDAIPILPCFEMSVHGPFLELVAERALLSPFAYDWRRDARDVSRELVTKLESLAATRKRIALVGHSLGGLIALHAVRHGAAAFVDRLVVAGAPFAGSPSFLRDMTEGDTVGRNRTLLAKEAWFTWPSAFQLLPVQQDELVWAHGDHAHLVRMLEARRVFRDELHAGEVRTETLVVIGCGRPTIESVAIEERLDFGRAPRAPGDGRVTEASARPAGFAFQEVKTTAEHSKLFDDPAVQEAIFGFIFSSRP